MLAIYIFAVKLTSTVTDYIGKMLIKRQPVAIEENYPKMTFQFHRAPTESNLILQKPTGQNDTGINVGQVL